MKIKQTTKVSSKSIEPILDKKKINKYLKQLKEYSKETYEHCIRVSLLSMYLGYKNGFHKTKIKFLGYAGLVHDIGKLDIPKKILKSRSSLSEKERKKINEHPRLSFLKLKAPEYDELKKIIVAHHEFQKKSYPRSHIKRRAHERFGKDRRTKSKKFETMSQILAISDMYDALSSKRSYKKPLDKKTIKKILQKQFTGNKKYIKQILDRETSLIDFSNPLVHVKETKKVIKV